MFDTDKVTDADRDEIEQSVREVESTDELEDCVLFAQILRSAAIEEINRRRGNTPAGGPDR